MCWQYDDSSPPESLHFEEVFISAFEVYHPFVQPGFGHLILEVLCGVQTLSVGEGG